MGCWLRFFKTLDLKGRLGCSKEGWMRMTSLVRQLRQSLDFVGALVLLEQDYSLFKIYPMMLAEDKVLYTVMGQKAAGGPFGQDRSGTGGLVVSPGVNAFWSAGVRRAAALEQVANVERPLDRPPLAGPPVTFGPVQALGVDHGGSGLLQPGVGPEQAPSHLVSAGMSPVQAPLVGAGPEQASMRLVAAGMSLGQAPMGGAGLVQAHGAECRQGGPEQARGGVRGAGPVQALTNGALSQPSPEKSVEELRLRIMKEAEENFIREAKKLKGEEVEGEIRSYHTASSGVPPMPALQGTATATSLAMQQAGHGLQGGAHLAGQGHQLVWSQPVSPMAVNSPGLPSGHSPGLHGGAWASHGHLQAGGLCGGAGSMVHSQGCDWCA